MNKLHSVFWDLDGTLADTEMSGHRRAFNHAFNDFDLDWCWSPSLYKHLLSVAGGKERINYYCKSINLNLDDNLVVKIHKRKQFHYSSLLRDGKISLRLGVLRLVNELYKKNIKQFVVTTSSSDVVDIFINKYFMYPFKTFTSVITSENVENHKPHPEAYLLALKISNTHPSNALAIEDSLIGLNAAKSAKISCLLTLSPWLSSIPEGMISSDPIVDHLGDTNHPINSFNGDISEPMINYNFLLSLLNNK